MPSKTFRVATLFTANDHVTKKLKHMGKAAAGVARQSGMITAAAGAAIVSIFNVNRQFQKSMNRIEARLGDATGDQLLQLRNTAKELGRTTAFSAVQAADGMAFLAQAGWDVADILQGIPHMLDMAAAAELDLATTSDIVSNIMAQFGMEASQTKEAVDILAAGTSAANIDLSMMADTMKGAGPIAKNFGATLKDATVIAGFLGNMGIQGTNAMTAMKGMFNVLSNPTPKAQKWFDTMNLRITEMGTDGTRKMRDVADIFQDMGDEMAKMDQPTRLKAIGQIFGKIVAPGASAMSQDVAKAESSFTALAKRLDIVDDRAHGMAVTMMQDGAGSVEILMSAVEGLSIAMGEAGLMGATVAVIQGLTDFVTMLTEHAPVLTWIIGLLFGVAAAVTAVAGAIVIAAKIWAVWITAIGIAKVAWLALNSAFIATPIGAIITGVVVLIGLFVALVTRLGGVKKAFIVLGQTILQALVFPFQLITKAIIGFLNLAAKIPGMGEKFGGMADTIAAKQDEINQKYMGTTSILTGSRLVEAVIKGDGSTPDTPKAPAGTVDVNVTNRSPEAQEVKATGTGGGLKMKLNPAAS